MRRLALMPALVCCLCMMPSAAAESQGALYPELAEAGSRFSFVINADPQIGPRDGEHASERRLYRLLEEFVEETNAMDPSPAFTLFNGDMVAFARAPYFDAFVEAARPLEQPIMLVHGNHDGRYTDTYFLDMQEELSGFRALWYSFDCGDWHFAVIPGKEQLPTPEDQQAVVEWLDADLAANADRPTMVFVHYHLFPTGISQSEYYTLDLSFRNGIIDVCTRHPQVQYVISGHVHAGIKSSVKSSWTYKDTHFIIAPSPVSPRNFGEEFPEFLPKGEENMGYYLVVHVDGDAATFEGRKTGSDASFIYPERFKEFDDDSDPGAFVRAGDQPARPALVNGGFDDGFDGWWMPHRYLADDPPGYEWTTGPAPRRDGQAARLFVREMGRDWAYDEYLEKYQLVDAPAGGAPVLRASYLTPLADKSHFGGGYIRVTGYREGTAQFMMFFHWGANEERSRHMPLAILYRDEGRQRGLRWLQSLANQHRLLCFAVPDYFDQWVDIAVPLEAVYDEALQQEGAFVALGIEKYLVGFGVWCGMEPGVRSGAWFSGISLDSAAGDEVAAVHGRPLRVPKDVVSPPFGKWYYLWGYDK